MPRQLAVPNWQELVGFYPGEINGEDVIIIVRVGKFQPLSWEVWRKFFSSANSRRSGRGGGKAKIYWCVTGALHT